jgi:hypothetical protein
VGEVVKHRQLARQVGVFIKHPLENSMASLSFTSTMLDEGTTFILGGFDSNLVDSRKPKAPAATRRSDLDELLLLNLPWQIEKISVFNTTPTCAPPGLLGSDSNRSEEAAQSKSLSDLEEDWIIFSRLEIREPPLVGGPCFRQLLILKLRVPFNYKLEPRRTQGRGSHRSSGGPSPQQPLAT